MKRTDCHYEGRARGRLSRVLSLIIAAVLLFSALPMTAVPAYAEDNAQPVESELSQPAPLEKGAAELADTGADTELADTGDEGSFIQDGLVWFYRGSVITDCTPKNSSQKYRFVYVPSSYTDSSGDMRIFYAVGSGAFSSSYSFFDVSAIVMGPYEDGTWTVGSDLLSGSRANAVYLNDSGTINIGKWAFRNVSGNSSFLHYIKIPDSVRYIGEEAFLNSYVTLNYLNDTVTTIEKGAFKQCKQITSFIIPRSLKRIEESTFDTCKNLKYVFIGNNIEYIGSMAFADTAIEQIYLPPSVTEIEDDAFGTNLKIIYGESGSYAQTWASAHGIPFANGYEYTVNSDNTVTITKCDLEAVHYFPEKLGGKTVTRIGAGAFKDTQLIVGEQNGRDYWNTSIRKPALGENIRYIGAEAFSSADLDLSLCGDAVIEAGAFDDASTVNMTVVGDKDIRSGFFAYGTVTDLTVESGVKNIGADAFRMCAKLNNVNLNKGVQTVGDRAFYKCESLKSVTIPKSVTAIGSMAFGYCEEYEKPKKMDDFTVRGYRGTAAERYATENGFTFEALDKAYDIWLGSVQVTTDNEDDILGDGKATYSSGVLTLSDPVINGSHADAKIYSKDHLTVKGSYRMTKADAAYGARSERSLYLNGDFTFKGTQIGVYGAEYLTVTAGSLTASGRYGAGVGETGRLTVGNVEKVDLTGSEAALCDSASQIKIHNSLHMSVPAGGIVAKDTEGKYRFCEADGTTAAKRVVLDHTIVEAKIIECDYPRKGYDPDFYLSVPAEKGYGIDHVNDDHYNNGIRWYNETDGRYMDSSEEFELDKKYTVSVMLKTSSDDYHFDPSVKGYVSGRDANVTFNNKRSVTLSRTFTLASIRSMSCTLTTPVIGAEHDDFAKTPNGSAYSALVNTWWRNEGDDLFGHVMMTGDLFDKPGKYTAVVLFTANTGYGIADDAAVTVNGMKATLRSSNSYNTYYVSFNIGNGTVTGLSIEGTPKAFAGKLKDEASLPHEYVSIPSTCCFVRSAWYMYISKYDTYMDFERFIAGERYRPKYIIEAQPGYALDESVTVKFADGSSQTVQTESGSATITVDGPDVICGSSYVTVSSVAITDVKEPVPGNKPAYTSKVPADSGFAINKEYSDTGYKDGVCWYNVTDDEVMSASDTFAAGKKYQATVRLKSLSGYACASAVTGTINGNTASGSGVVFRYTFTCQKVVDKIKINGVPKAVAGESAASSGALPGNCVSIEGDNGYISSSEWKELKMMSGRRRFVTYSDAFEADSMYYPSYVISPKSGYSFTEFVTVTFADGSVTDAPRLDDGTLSVRGPGVNTIAVATIKTVDVIWVEEPADGASPAYCANNTGSGYMVEDYNDDNCWKNGVCWYHNSREMSFYDAFEAGETYAVQVSLVPVSDEYRFSTSGLRGTLNGNPAVAGAFSSYTAAENIYVQYYFTVPEASKYTVGDVNGDEKVNNRDAMILDRYVSGWEGYKEKIVNMDAADLDRKGTVDNRDAIILDRYIAGWTGYDKYIITV